MHATPLHLQAELLLPSSVQRASVEMPLPLASPHLPPSPLTSPSEPLARQGKGHPAAIQLPAGDD